MQLWSVDSCFQWYKNYKHLPRNARVIVENNVASFFRTRCRLKHFSACRQAELHCFDVSGVVKTLVADERVQSGVTCAQIPHVVLEQSGRFKPLKQMTLIYHLP